MSASPDRPKTPFSLAPRRQLVRHGDVTLVIAELSPHCERRPLAADVHLLELFSALMAEQGFSAHVSRMAFDRIYAHERFTLGKRRGRKVLRTLATGLLGCHAGGNATTPP